MSNEGGRFRKKKSNFSMVSNVAIWDENISLKAKGLYTLIQSYITIENFILYKDFLQSKCKEGRESFNSAWKELKNSGYLVQYKMRDSQTKQFYWEYELLDEVEPYPENPYDGSPPQWNPRQMEKQGNNNTILNNTLKSNTNQIISISDVKEQIGYITFSNANRDQLDEIVMLITDVLNSSDDKQIRIAKENISAVVVKQRFKSLNNFHIEYVLECLKNNSAEIGNVKNYLLTTLYNAPMTMNTYYQNKYSQYSQMEHNT